VLGFVGMNPGRPTAPQLNISWIQTLRQKIPSPTGEANLLETLVRWPGAT
jgi:hypothetical protein